MKARDTLFRLEDLRYLLVQRFKFEAASLANQGPAPGQTPSWEVHNWNVDDNFWQEFEFLTLVIRLRCDRPWPPHEVLVPFPGGFKVYLELFNKLEKRDFPNQSDLAQVDRNGKYAPVADWVVVRPSHRMPPGSHYTVDYNHGQPSSHRHELPSRQRYFYYQAMLKVLPDTGLILLSESQLDNMDLDRDQPRFKPIQVHRLGC